MSVCALTGFAPMSPTEIISGYADGNKVISRNGYDKLPDDMRRPVFLHLLVRLFAPFSPGDWSAVHTGSVFLIDRPRNTVLARQHQLRSLVATLPHSRATAVHNFRCGKYITSTGLGGEYDIMHHQDPISRVLGELLVIDTKLRTAFEGHLEKIRLIPAKTLAAFLADPDGVWVLTWDGERAGLSNRGPNGVVKTVAEAKTVIRENTHPDTSYYILEKQEIVVSVSGTAESFATDLVAYFTNLLGQTGESKG